MSWNEIIQHSKEQHIASKKLLSEQFQKSIHQRNSLKTNNLKIDQ